jgi:hypothetical protein
VAAGEAASFTLSVTGSAPTGVGDGLGLGEDPGPGEDVDGVGYGTDEEGVGCGTDGEAAPPPHAASVLAAAKNDSPVNIRRKLISRQSLGVCALVTSTINIKRGIVRGSALRPINEFFQWRLRSTLCTTSNHRDQQRYWLARCLRLGPGTL